MAFPTPVANNELYTVNGFTYQWSDPPGVWKIVSRASTISNAVINNATINVASFAGEVILNSNVIVNNSIITVGNSSIYAIINSTSFSGSANSTLTANAAGYLNGKLEADLNVNNALTANAAGYLNGKLEANLNVNNALTANAAGYLNGKLEANLNVNNALTSNNSSYLGTVAAANYITSNGNYTLSGDIVFTSNLIIGNTGDIIINSAAGIWANGSFGSNAQILTSNGSAVYWSTGVTASSLTANSIAITTGTITIGNSTVNTDIGNNYVSVGNSTSYVNLYSTYAYIGNSTANATINSTVYTGTANNASYLGGTAAASYMQNTNSRTLSGNLIFSGANVVFSGNVRINGGLIANGSLGTSGQILASNGSAVFWTAGITANSLTANSIAITTGTITVGNSTVNTDIGNNYISVGNSISYVNVYSTYAYIGNSSANATINSTTYTGTANNASYLGGTAAASYMQNTNSRTLSGNLYFTGSNNTFDGQLVIGANGDLQIAEGAGIKANGSFGTSGQILASNGTSVFWTAGITANSLTANSIAITTGTITVGNSTVNTDIGNNYISVGNSISYVNVYSTYAYIGNSSANATINSTIYTGTANNANYLGATAAAKYVQNTDNRTLSGNLYFTGANNTFDGQLIIGTLGDLQIAEGAGIKANGSFGTNDQVLASNGTSVFWTTVSASANASYIQNTDSRTLSGNLNFTGANSYFSGKVTHAANVVLLAGIDVIDSTGARGTVGQVLTSNGAANVYWATVSASPGASYIQNTDSRTLSGNLNFTGVNTYFSSGNVTFGNSTVNTSINSTGVALTNLYNSGNSYLSANVFNIAGASANVSVPITNTVTSVGNSYCMEFFVRLPTMNSTPTHIIRTTAATGMQMLISSVGFEITESGYEAEYAGATFEANTWYHIAYIGTGSFTYLLVNGVQCSFYTSNTFTTLTGTPTHGGAGGGGGYTRSGVLEINPIRFYAGTAGAGQFNISNFRITAGSNVYSTSGFTPPNATLTSIAGTQVLLYTSNTFTDAGPYALSVTNNLGTVANSFGPFISTTPVTINTSLFANTINASSYTVGAIFTANATLVNTAAINVTGQVNTATLYATTSANVGANVRSNTSAYLVSSNSTVNTIITATTITQINTTATPFIANVTGLYHTGTMNAASHTVGTSFIANTTGAYHTGTINAASYRTTGFVANVTAIVPTSNTILLGNTTGRFVLSANTGDFSGSITATGLIATVTGASTTEILRGNIADTDYFRILIGGTATNQGYVEIATADDGTEPIYVRQYTGVFTTLTRTATLLDGSGNSIFPGSVNAASHIVGTNFIANTTALVSTGFANVTTSVNSALLTVGTSFIANTTGAYHSGTMNAASHTVGALFTANSTLVNAAAINITGQVNTVTLYATTSANVGTLVRANTTAYLVGSNSTVNTVITATSITQSNTTAVPFVANVTGVYHTGVVNAASHTVGTTFTANATLVNAASINITGQVNTVTLYATTSANVGTLVRANTTAYLVGSNSTVNTVITATSITQSNTTAVPFVANVTGVYHTGVVNAASLKVGTNFIANSTQLTLSGTPLSSNGGTGTSGQVLTSNGTIGAPYWVAAAAGTNVAAQYAWTNTHSFSNVITFSSTTATTNATTGAVLITGGLGVSGNAYTKGVVGFSNATNKSVVYTYYNATTNSLDTVFG